MKAKKITPTKKTKKDDSEEKFICCTCGHSYSVQKSNFRPSKSPRFAGNNGFLPICKGCLEKELKQYDNDYDSEYKAMRRICQAWDIYYNRDLHKVAKKGKGIDFLLGAYFSNLNFDQWGGGRKTYDDTLAEEGDIGIDGAISSVGDIEDAKKSGELKVSSKAVRIWGFGFSPEDYEYLENNFSDWKAKVIVDGKARETLVRELCIIKLQQNKAIQEANIDLYEKLSRLYQKTLTSASLEPLQEDTNEKAGEKPMGVMIQMFESERPAPDPDPEWEDVDGIVRFITVYFLGHLSKMLKLKNKYAMMYDEEMNRYKVEIPELENADEDDIFEYIINGGDNNESSE